MPDWLGSVPRLDERGKALLQPMEGQTPQNCEGDEDQRRYFNSLVIFPDSIQQLGWMVTSRTVVGFVRNISCALAALAIGNHCPLPHTAG